MSGAQGVSTERLSSLLGHVTHKGFDDLVDPKNQGIAYPTGNPDLLITGDSLFYTNLLATLDMFRLNSSSLNFSNTEEGNQFRRRQKLTRSKFSFTCTRENPMPKHRWESYLRQVKAMVDSGGRVLPFDSMLERTNAFFHMHEKCANFPRSFFVRFARLFLD